MLLLWCQDQLSSWSQTQFSKKLCCKNMRISEETRLKILLNWRQLQLCPKASKTVDNPLTSARFKGCCLPRFSQWSVAKATRHSTVGRDFSSSLSDCFTAYRPCPFLTVDKLSVNERVIAKKKSGFRQPVALIWAIALCVISEKIKHLFWSR